eukprot:3514914-Prymnesium_polylepis.1
MSWVSGADTCTENFWLLRKAAQCVISLISDHDFRHFTATATMDLSGRASAFQQHASSTHVKQKVAQRTRHPAARDPKPNDAPCCYQHTPRWH